MSRGLLRLLDEDTKDHDPPSRSRDVDRPRDAIAAHNPQFPQLVFQMLDSIGRKRRKPVALRKTDRAITFGLLVDDHQEFPLLTFLVGSAAGPCGDVDTGARVADCA